MFVQAPRSLERSQGGIGLGLTLVKAVTAMHDGTIHAASEGIGQGSQFLLRLPLADQVPVPKRTLQVSNNIKKVVIIEDIDDAREMLSKLLELEGYDVLSAADGKSGLKLIGQQQPDLALIDIGLPELNGYQVAKQLRASPETERLFLVALTGYGQTNDRELVKKAGFDGHLVKPLNMNQFRGMLSER
jgi:two-component system CheB/CheR fusion protein